MSDDIVSSGRVSSGRVARGRVTRGDKPLAGRVLVVEASTPHGSVALLASGAVAADVDARMGASREDSLFPAVQQALDGLAVRDLDAIVCGAGPGSFTSLRIAASLVKGLAHGADVPVFAVPSLLLAAASYAPEGENGADRIGEYVVHADALRGERFVRAVAIDTSGARLLDGATTRVAFADLSQLAAGRGRLAVVGSPHSDQETAIVVPRATALPGVAGWQQLEPIELETWEPEYGRLAEAQVVWERSHGHALPIS